MHHTTCLKVLKQVEHTDDRHRVLCCVREGLVSVQKAIIHAHSIAWPSVSEDLGHNRSSLVEPPKLWLLLMPTMSWQKDGLPPLERIAEGHAYIVKGFDESLAFAIRLNDCG